MVAQHLFALGKAQTSPEQSRNHRSQGQIIPLHIDRVYARITHYKYDDNDSTNLKKRGKVVWAYVVPNGATWKEIVQRYYYDEDGHSHELAIPDSLRSKKYVAVRGSVTSVSNVTNVDGVNGTVTNVAEVTVTPIPTPKKYLKKMSAICADKKQSQQNTAVHWHFQFKLRQGGRS
jgi:hypothetical protein